MKKSEIDKILKDIVVVIDTREKSEETVVDGKKVLVYKNQHIRDYLDKIDVKYKLEKLEFGDYSYDIPNHPELSRLVAIERKCSLDEIASNFGKNRERFVREFERAVDLDISTFCVIENASWKKVFNAKWRGAFHKNAMISSIMGFGKKYNCPFYLVSKHESPELIYNLLIWDLKKKLEKI